MICPNCKKEIENDSNYCGYCSTQIKQVEPAETAEENQSTQKYPALKSIASIYNIIAVIHVIICAVVAFIILPTVVGPIICGLVGVLGYILLISAKESIYVFVDIEENTRKIAENTKPISKK